MRTGPTVVVYPPDWPSTTDDAFEVWVCDLVHEGQHVASAKTRQAANEAGVSVAMQVRGRLLPWRKGE